MARSIDPTAAPGGATPSTRWRLPAWVLFILASLMLVVFAVAVSFTVDHIADGGSTWPFAFIPALLGGLCLGACALGYRRLRGGPRSLSRIIAAFIIGTLGLAIVSVLTGGVDEGRAEGLMFAPWIMAGAMALGIGISVMFWQRMDEAAREAHKWASYWGVGAGMTVGAPLFLFEEGSARIRDQLGLGDSFANGALSVVLLQLAGYGLAWGFWWLRRR